MTMTKKKSEIKEQAKEMPVITEKTTQLKTKKLPPVVIPKPIPKSVAKPLDPPVSKKPVIKTPDMDVSSVKAIHEKMRIINAKLKSTDLKDQEEGKADLEALTIKVREEANKIDIRTKFLGNV